MISNWANDDYSTVLQLAGYLVYGDTFLARESWDDAGPELREEAWSLLRDDEQALLLELGIVPAGTEGRPDFGSAEDDEDVL
jgi:hypothetical protein